MARRRPKVTCVTSTFRAERQAPGDDAVRAVRDEVDVHGAGLALTPGGALPESHGVDPCHERRQAGCLTRCQTLELQEPDGGARKRRRCRQASRSVHRIDHPSDATRRASSVAHPAVPRMRAPVARRSRSRGPAQHRESKPPGRSSRLACVCGHQRQSRTDVVEMRSTACGARPRSTTRRGRHVEIRPTTRPTAPGHDSIRDGLRGDFGVPDRGSGELDPPHTSVCA
jgi:hypothetical protein